MTKRSLRKPNLKNFAEQTLKVWTLKSLTPVFSLYRLLNKPLQVLKQFGGPQLLNIAKILKKIKFALLNYIPCKKQTYRKIKSCKGFLWCLETGLLFFFCLTGKKSDKDKKQQDLI